MCKIEFFLFLQLQYVGLVMSKPIRIRPVLKLSYFNQNMNNKYYERSQIRLTYTPYKSDKLDIKKRQECGPPNFPDISCQRDDTFMTKSPNGMILRDKNFSKKKLSNKSPEPSKDNQENIEPQIIDFNGEKPFVSRVVHYTTTSKQVDDVSKHKSSKEKEDAQKFHNNKEEENKNHNREKTETSKHHESTAKENSSKHENKEKNSNESSKDPSITSSTSAPYVDGTSTPSLHDHATRCNNFAKCDVKSWPTY